jgi:mitochondrial fission protein ELM1
MSATITAPRVWGLVDDRTGHRGQVLGVLMRLGLPYAIKRLEYNALVALPAVLTGASLMTVDLARSAPLTPPYPDLVVAAGRRTLPILRYLKQQSPSMRSVYLMHAEVNRDIDLMVVPEHDHPAPAPNILTTVAPLHAVTPEVLAAARSAWEPQFESLARPYVTLCLGGETKHGRYHASDWRELTQRAMALVGEGSLLISTSRRTPPEALHMIEPLLQVPHLLYRWDKDKDNPYLGMLACADAIVVTGDSLSMCAEVCVPGVPVFIFARPHVAPPKHREMHQRLYDRGLAHPLNNMAHMQWKPAAALDDVDAVARAIMRRFPELASPPASAA